MSELVAVEHHLAVNFGSKFLVRIAHVRIDSRVDTSLENFLNAGNEEDLMVRTYHVEDRLTT